LLRIKGAAAARAHGLLGDILGAHADIEEPS
jgi:hypothetical protein